MRANRSVDTAPELRLRSALHAMGLRFRVNHRIRLEGLAVRPDIVFTRKRVAVFVDGCFWHGCPEHMSWPRRNGPFWKEKIEANRARDERQTVALRQTGWTVVRLWEHVELTDALRSVLDALEQKT